MTKNMHYLIVNVQNVPKTLIKMEIYVGNVLILVILALEKVPVILVMIYFMLIKENVYLVKVLAFYVMVIMIVLFVKKWVGKPLLVLVVLKTGL